VSRPARARTAGARLGAARARALAAAAAALLAPAPPAPAAEELVDAIAAQVGSDIVLTSEVMQMVGPLEEEMRKQGAPEAELAKLRADALERMIEWRLIEQTADRMELHASDAEVDAAIDAIAKENALTTEQLKASVASHGLEYEEYRSQIKHEIERANVLRAAVGTGIQIDEAEVRRLFEERYASQPAGGEQVHLRQLLVPSGEGTGRTREQACALVEKARTRVLAGEPFEAVAREENVAAREQGGDIGWLHVDQLAPWMLSVVRPLQPGQLSPAVELPVGCSVLELVDRQEYAPVDWEAAKPALERELYATLEERERRAWLEKLRSQTYIERKGHFAGATTLTAPPAR
jgi:peptidyl-prolyl cis-trans isomerase SurA